MLGLIHSLTKSSDRTRAVHIVVVFEDEGRRAGRVLRGFIFQSRKRWVLGLRIGETFAFWVWAKGCLPRDTHGFGKGPS